LIPKEEKMDTLLHTKMTRLNAMAAVAALASFAGMTGTSRPVLAQEAPVSEPVWETLGIAKDLWLAPGMTMELARFTFMPGYAQEIHTHTGVDVVAVVSGEVAWRIEHGEAMVFRTPVDGAPAATETVPDVGEATLGAGDAIVFDYGRQKLWHAGRTVGSAPVVMLFANLYDPSKPITVYAEDLATPNP
jgi:hypothetical protein